MVYLACSFAQNSSAGRLAWLKKIGCADSSHAKRTADGGLAKLFCQRDGFCYA